MESKKRDATNEHTYKIETEKELMVAKVAVGRIRGRDSEGVWDERVHTAYLKCITNQDLLYSTGNSAQCCVAAWMGGEFGREWIHGYVWLSPSAIHLKL